MCNPVVKVIILITVYVMVGTSLFIIVNIIVPINIDKYFATFTNTTCTVIGSRVYDGNEYPTIRYIANDKTYTNRFPYTSDYYVTGYVFKCYYSSDHPNRIWSDVPYYTKHKTIKNWNWACTCIVLGCLICYMPIVMVVMTL